jgi:predicted dehydrogenase
MDEGEVKIALVGSGRWGANVARELAATGRLAAIVSRTPEALPAQEAASALGVPVMTLEAVCARTDIQAVWVATPITSHREIATRLLEAGKHVMLEKPATGNADEAAALADAAADRGRMFATGYVFLYHPVFRELKRLLTAQTVREVSCIWKKLGSFSEPIGPNLFTHHLSLALDLFGAPQQGMLNIFANGNMLQAKLEYPDLTFTSSIDRENEQREHTFDFTLADGSVYRWDGQFLLMRAQEQAEFSIIFETSDTALAAEVHAFLTAIETGDPSTLPTKDAFGARVLDAYAALASEKK